jgi:Ca2+-binding EF-hand superfamily protein
MVALYRQLYNEFVFYCSDIDNDGFIDVQDLFRACKTPNGKKFTYEELLQAVRDLKPHEKLETVSKTDFLTVPGSIPDCVIA